jgi:2-amino-4-hydroxy-6-hydroxymethyldihydropteridine diphosphokinase
MNPESGQGRAVAYIGLGANLGDPAAQLRSARAALAGHPAIVEIACSRLYRSAPLGPGDQPPYINAVMAVATTLEPLALLKVLQQVEQQHGRTRDGQHWGPRTLDLDLLLYDQSVIDSKELQIPHPGIAEREFVLQPLLDLAPRLEVPGLGPVELLLATCPRRDSRLEPIDDE